MDDIRTEKWTLDDGRHAERRVTETVTPAGEGERVIELHVEDERPLKLQQRVVEKRKPIIYEREIQQIDAAGNVVEKKIESVEPRAKMQLVEHISTSSPVTAQATPEDCDCHVTKEEMIETIIAAMRTFREEAPAPKDSGLADEIGKRVEGNTGGTMDTIMWVVIGGLVIGLGYVLFGM